MEAKISAMSVHQGIRSRINRHKPGKFTHRREEGRFMALIVLSHWLVTICFSCCCKRGRVCLAFSFFFFLPHAQCPWFFCLILLYTQIKSNHLYLSSPAQISSLSLIRLFLPSAHPSTAPHSGSSVEGSCP